MSTGASGTGREREAAGQDSLRFMIAGEGESGPRLEKGSEANNLSMSAQVKEKPHAKATKPPVTQTADKSQPLSAKPVAKAVAARNKKAAPVRLGNFEKMITTTLKKPPELILKDGEFPKIVQKGAKEIIQALHKTNDRAVIQKHLEQFTRCEKLLKELNHKLVTLIAKTSKNDQAKRDEIAGVTDIVNMTLAQFNNEAPFLEAFKPRDIPNTLIGMIASFLPEEEADKMLDPLLDQFAGKSEREMAKATALKEAHKGEKLAKEVSTTICEALKKEGDHFVLSRELKEKLQFVTELNLSDLGVPLSAKALKELISNCPHLVSLNLSRNPVTKELMDVLVEGLKELRHIDLNNTDSDDSVLASVAKLRRLQSIDCQGCGRITTLASLASCENLQSLNCSGCNKITSLEPLASCKNFQQLDCSWCAAITSLEPLASCKNLQHLECSWCVAITSLEPLASCKNLQQLNCCGCKAIPTLEPLASCENLQQLNCSCCNAITTLEPLASCKNLQQLVCAGCEAILTLEPLASCENLQQLNCPCCNAITTLEPLASCKNLQQLDCSWCKAITTLEPLASCKNLQQLDCFGCKAIPTVEPLVACSKLRGLGCQFCPLITDEMVTTLKQALPELEVNKY